MRAQVKCRNESECECRCSAPPHSSCFLLSLKPVTLTQMKHFLSCIAHVTYVGQNPWFCHLQAVCLMYVPGALASYVFSYFLPHTLRGHLQASINMYTYMYTHICAFSSLHSDSPVQRFCPLQPAGSLHTRAHTRAHINTHTHHQAPFTHIHTGSLHSHTHTLLGRVLGLWVT